MFVAAHPEELSPSLTEALLDAGCRLVPILDAATVTEREPEDGWRAVVVELGNDPARGLAMARRIREIGVSVLVVAQRAHASELPDSIEGFDDFLLSPIDPIELALRLRRLPGGRPDGGDDIVVFKDLELNLATYQARVADSPVDLTYMEYELLRFFVTKAGRAWSREQLLQRVWGYDYFGGSRTVDVHVRRLRAKLGEERASWITTVRSVGYRFG